MPRHGKSHTLLALLVATSSFLGCAKVDFVKSIDKTLQFEVAEERPSPLRLDTQASFIQIYNDHFLSMQPARYQRTELLEAIRAAWNGPSPTAGKALTARVALIAEIQSSAHTWTAAILHAFIGLHALTLLGIPERCASSRLTLVIQLQDGRTFVGKGKGSGCAGVYYPGDPQQKALLAAIEDSLSRIRETPKKALIDQIPVLSEIPNIRGHHEGTSSRVVWDAKRSEAFPRVWGD